MKAHKKYRIDVLKNGKRKKYYFDTKEELGVFMKTLKDVEDIYILKREANGKYEAIAKKINYNIH